MKMPEQSSENSPESLLVASEAISPPLPEAQKPPVSHPQNLDVSVARAELDRFHDAAPELEVSPESQRTESQVAVASVNTHWGRTLQEEGGLGAVAGADILLLQEVIQSPEQVQEQLGREGFELVHYEPRFGLAMARKTDSKLQFVEGSVRVRQLAQKGRFENKIAKRWAKQAHEFTERGVLAAKFMDKNGAVMTAVDVHPSTGVMPFRRAAQVKKIGEEIMDSYYGDIPVVVGGDWNHYEGPLRVDKKMRSEVGLSEASTGGKPTWHIKEASPLFKYGAMASAMIGGRPMSDYNAYFDAVLYRGEGLIPDGEAEVLKVPSDHRAILAQFKLAKPKE